MWRSAFLVVVGLMAVAKSSLAGEYSIQSPTEGATIRPGQPFQVIVGGPPAVNVFVFPGIGNLSGSQVAAPPYIYTFDVPPSVQSGAYKIKVYVEKPGGLTEILTTNVLVEPDLAGGRLVAEPEDLRLTFFGQTKSMNVRVLSPSGESSVLTSPNLTVQSLAAGVISPLRAGAQLMAIGPGSAVVSYQFQGIQARVVADVEVSPLAGDLNADGRVDQLDINIVQERVGMAKMVPNDSRDINQDGKIDALDLRALTSMCSKPRCAI